MIYVSDIHNRKKIVPKIIYRGISLSYEEFKHTNIKKEMYPPYAPIINENGVKVDGNGNEYGVYMSDNKSVAKMYAKNIKSTPIKPNIDMGYGERLQIPAIQIVYQVNTNELNVRPPIIAKKMEGVYNNGITGDEWIVDYVPASNYKSIDINIGKDYLHDEEEIICDDIDESVKLVLEKMNLRKYHLESLAWEINNAKKEKIDVLSPNKKEILRMIFGANGIKYKTTSEVKKIEDVIELLKQKFYNNHISEMDISSFKYVMELEKQLLNTNTKNDIYTLLNILEQNLALELEKKEKFIQRKIQEKQVPKTSAFDYRIDRIKLISETVKMYIPHLNNVNNKSLSNDENMIDKIDDVVESYPKKI